ERRLGGPHDDPAVVGPLAPDAEGFESVTEPLDEGRTKDVQPVHVAKRMAIREWAGFGRRVFTSALGLDEFDALLPRQLRVGREPVCRVECAGQPDGELGERVDMRRTLEPLELT